MLKKIILYPFLMVIYILNPIVRFRFGFIDASRIGHFCFSAGYLFNKTFNKQPFSIDILMYSNEICNQYLMKLFSKQAFIIKYNKFVWLLICYLKKNEKLREHIIKFQVRELRLLQGERYLFSFTESELKKGEQILEGLGIPKGSKWVCIHNRDNNYLSSTYPGKDWKYHDFRDFDVNDLLPAAEELAERGYYVLRMGSAVAKPMLSNNPKIIDYASHALQGEFADIFLLGRCEFYLGSDSGIFAVSTLFKKPFAFINFPVPEQIYLEYYWNNTPFLLKRMRDKKTGKYLSLKQIIAAGLQNASTLEAFENANVELVSNTPEEIRQLAIETEERINNKWVLTKEDEELQKEYWNIHNHVFNNCYDKKVQALIGAHFLRNNKYLLD